MLRIKEAVVVEGKHDRIRLSKVVDAPVVETGGFRVFRDKEKAALLRRLAASHGLVILTDSDSAGFVIRQHLCGIVPPSQIKHAYCPRVFGKERRKETPSKEGVLGVEGVDVAALETALRQAGVTLLSEDTPPPAPWLTKARMYEDGLVGREQSAKLRGLLLQELGLPPYLSTERLREVLELTSTETEYAKLIQTLIKKL